MAHLTTTEENIDSEISPLCREIRSKKVFHLKTIPMKPSDVQDLSGHCWCRMTQQVIGPDENHVDPNTCNSSRSCYKSHFEHV